MNFRLTIASKLMLGFGILVAGIFLSSILTFTTLSKNERINRRIMEVYTPSVEMLNQCFNLVSETKMLIKNWVTDRKSDTPDKLRLKQIHQFDFPRLRNNLNALSQKWDPESRKAISEVLAVIGDTLIIKHMYIMNQLGTFESYDDPMVIFEIAPLVEEGGIVLALTDQALGKITKISEVIRKQSDTQVNEMNRSFSVFKTFIIWSGVILIVISLFTATVTIRSITLPLNQVKTVLLTLSKGILPKEKLHVENNEIGDMAEALNNFIISLKETAEFALEIGKGIYTSSFKPLSDEDILGNSLINMRDNLKKADEEDEKRKHEDELRNWEALGLAKFSDILRQNNDNMNKLANTIMSNLVNYLDANQGALFILNDHDPKDLHFELKAVIAYGRSKLMNKRVELNEGLIGRCTFEKMTILLKEIPDDYINITSGLGGARPQCLLLVPLKLNDGIFGVIELASFEVFKPHHVEFVEKLGENIASTISTVRINERTARLLAESQLHREELAAQEEEMRQNMEELQATQEESTRREQEMREIIDALNNTVGSLELDMYGTIANVNDKFASFLRISAADIIGKPQRDLLVPDSFDSFDMEELWEKLRIGMPSERISQYKTSKGDVWCRETYTPFKNMDGDYDKVFVLAVDITREKAMEMQSSHEPFEPEEKEEKEEFES